MDKSPGPESKSDLLPRSGVNRDRRDRVLVYLIGYKNQHAIVPSDCHKPLCLGIQVPFGRVSHNVLDLVKIKAS
jgi:hypothetical protein